MSLPVAIININYLKSNLDYLKSISDGSELYPVIKANAYGHGFNEIAQELDKILIKGVCIATVNELQNLVNLKVNYSILHMGKIVFSKLSLYESDNVIATINSISDLQKISKIYKGIKKIRVHIKIDTGMTRMGVSLENFDEIFQKCLSMDNVSLEGIYTHLANSDNNSAELNQIQIKLFDKIVSRIKKKKNIKFHILNSGGLFNYSNYKYDLIRTGIAMYGVSPLGIHNKNLKPVMEFKAPVILKKNIRKGTMIGYGNSYKAKDDMKIAIIQCGYGDGVPFEFSNKGFVYYNSLEIPIIGRVSMDLICIDISNISIQNNDYVTLWGSILNERSRLEYIAEFFDKIPYIYLTGITNRVEKIYVYD